MCREGILEKTLHAPITFTDNNAHYYITVACNFENAGRGSLVLVRAILPIAAVDDVEVVVMSGDV